MLRKFINVIFSLLAMIFVPTKSVLVEMSVWSIKLGALIGYSETHC